MLACTTRHTGQLWHMHQLQTDRSLWPIAGQVGMQAKSADRLESHKTCGVLTGRALWRLVGELGTHTGVAAPLVQVAASCTARPPSCGCPSPTKNRTGAWDSGCTGCSGSGAAGWQESVCTEAAFSSVTCTAASTAAAGGGCMLAGGASGAWWSAGHAAWQAAWVPKQGVPGTHAANAAGLVPLPGVACCDILLPPG